MNVGSPCLTTRLLSEKPRKPTKNWLGDWLAYGERAYGETYAQALDATDYEYGTLRDAMWVTKQFALSRRRDNLSWSHHREVAALPPDRQDHWLDRAEAEGLTRNGLRSQLTGSEDRHYRTQYTGDNEWYTPREVIAAVRALAKWVTAAQTTQYRMRCPHPHCHPAAATRPADLYQVVDRCRH